jgi:pimeloyl-ACP methyl ester carboxylesterase
LSLNGGTNDSTTSGGTNYRTAGPPLARLLKGMPVTQRRVDLAGVSTSLLEGGEGPPIVLLHGQGGFAAHWIRVIPHLVGSHRVVAPDLPGLGESEVREGRLDAPGLVAWLGDLIRQTCAEPPPLVGISVGGALAARFGVQSSDQVRRIVLVNSGGLGRALPTPGALVALVRYSIHRSPANFDRIIRYVVVDTKRIQADWGERWAALQAYDMDRTAQPRVREADGQLLRRINMPRIPPDQLRKIRVPVALIWSRKDRITRFGIAEEASARFGWPLYPIDDCGHFLIGERPDAFLEALEAAMGASPS